VDRALWLLLKLKARARVRHWARNVRTLKGMLLALVGALLAIPLVLSAALVPHLQTAGQVALIRQFGPVGLFAYCVLNVLLSTGERALVYTPAEVDHLFCGPFRPRQLLLYRVVGNLPAVCVGAVFATLLLQHHTALPSAAFLGLFLTLELLFLVSAAVSLCAGTLGALAFNRQRRLLLALTACLAVLAVVPVAKGVSAGTGDPLRRLAASPVLRFAGAPFRPFIMTFTAERAWPDMAVHGAVSALVDLGLLGLVVGLNFQFLEVSARASARRYEILCRARRGGSPAGNHPARVRVPALPWLGGAGPACWRQLTAAARSPGRVAAVFALFALAGVCPLLLPNAGGAGAPQGANPALVLLASLAVFAPTMLGYDFRPDLVRMAELKTLPVRPAYLVVGQLATPVIVMSLAEWSGLALVAAQVALPRQAASAAVVLGPPLNFVLVAVENLFFLWFPARFVAGASADFQMMGRQLLLMTGRLACGLFGAALAALLGVVGYYAAGGRWPAALAGGALGLAATGVGLVALLSQAFQDFDVARDRPE
jgi:hypothetical protein